MRSISRKELEMYRNKLSVVDPGSGNWLTLDDLDIEIIVFTSNHVSFSKCYMGGLQNVPNVSSRRLAELLSKKLNRNISQRTIQRRSGKLTKMELLAPRKGGLSNIRAIWDFSPCTNKLDLLAKRTKINLEGSAGGLNPFPPSPTVNKDLFAAYDKVISPESYNPPVPSTLADYKIYNNYRDNTNNNNKERDNTFSSTNTNKNIEEENISSPVSINPNYALRG